MVDQPNKDQRLDKVLEIIMSDTKDISIGALAGSVSLSVSRLQHLFKCTVGCSIRSHRKEVRLDRAAINANEPPIVIQHYDGLRNTIEIHL